MNSGKENVSREGFVSACIAELRKVHHPSRQEAIQATVITILFMVFFAVVLALYDWLLKLVIWQVI